MTQPPPPPPENHRSGAYGILPHPSSGIQIPYSNLSHSTTFLSQDGGTLMPLQTPQGIVMAQIPAGLIPIQTSAGMVFAPVLTAANYASQQGDLGQSLPMPGSATMQLPQSQSSMIMPQHQYSMPQSHQQFRPAQPQMMYPASTGRIPAERPALMSGGPPQMPVPQPPNPQQACNERGDHRPHEARGWQRETNSRQNRKMHARSREAEGRGAKSDSIIKRRQPNVGATTSHRSTTTDSAVSLSGASNQESILHEYHVDGETCVDDMVFASLFAKMDSDVLKHLKEFKPDVDLPISRQPTQVADKSVDQEDIESNPSSFDEEETRNLDEFLAELRNKVSTQGDGENEDKLSVHNDIDDAALAQIPEDIDVSNIGDVTTGDMKPLGSVLHDMKTLINVRAGYDQSATIYDIGSICCNGKRQVIGIIVDTIGPVISPFYIIKRIKDVTVESDETIFVDLNKSSVAEVATNVDDEDDDDEMAPDGVEDVIQDGGDAMQIAAG